MKAASGFQLEASTCLHELVNWNTTCQSSLNGQNAITSEEQLINFILKSIKVDSLNCDYFWTKGRVIIEVK